jgi:hypothetical protein
MEGSGAVSGSGSAQIITNPDPDYRGQHIRTDHAPDPEHKFFLLLSVYQIRKTFYLIFYEFYLF